MCNPDKHYPWRKIYDACESGDVDEVRRQILGSNVDLKYDEDAILAACENGHTEVVRLLLEYGADARVSGIGFRTPFGEAIRNGHAEIVRLLIDDYGVEVDLGLSAHGLSAIQPLIRATAAGHLEVVRVLLARGASPNTINDSGFEAGASALWLAIRFDRIEIARALIEAGAEVDFKGPRGVTPLLKAVWSGRLAMARLLLDCSSSSIDWACDRHVNSPRVQVPSTVDGGTVSLGGSTPLSLACLTGKVGLARLLLQRGARPATAVLADRTRGRQVRRARPGHAPSVLRGARHFRCVGASRAPSRHRAPDHLFSGPAKIGSGGLV